VSPAFFGQDDGRGSEYRLSRENSDIFAPPNFLTQTLP
jgi:hypothetical protein